MTAPSDDEHPTRVQQATAEQPAITAAPATRRTAIWQRKVPARIGRARTSTVVIGCLFVLLYTLNSTLPQDSYVTVDLPNGDTVRVRSSQISPAPTSPVVIPPATTGDAPGSTGSTASVGTPATTTGSPRTTADQPTTTAPRSTSTTTPPGQGRTTSAPPTSSAPTSASLAPSDTAAPTSSAPTG